MAPPGCASVRPRLNRASSSLSPASSHRAALLTILAAVQLCAWLYPSYVRGVTGLGRASLAPLPQSIATHSGVALGVAAFFLPGLLLLAVYRGAPATDWLRLSLAAVGFCTLATAFGGPLSKGSSASGLLGDLTFDLAAGDLGLESSRLIFVTVVVFRALAWAIRLRPLRSTLEDRATPPTIDASRRIRAQSPDAQRASSPLEDSDPIHAETRPNPALGRTAS
jgi:hypothetical protein